ncbi:hypothetical protein [Actinacidiphila oryziradicis]|uniref:Uncharacterized protein n=1 Tax=Actinacidiphila oryziradicis TaxID=2571141 RepID=A0A4U0SPF9_9ACTN|nr:hypothetical protein [Actinacidiphila oryziradicis]TKA11736.1 hypothetical protein FCI23_10420 [Actinacidiphila oryziradicis]
MITDHPAVEGGPDFNTWLAEHRAVGVHLKDRERAIHDALADFCEEYTVWPRAGLGIVASLWGFEPEVSVFAEDANATGHWFHLPDLSGPTGVDYDRLADEFDRDRADDYSDVALITWPGNNGLRIVRHTFAMRIFSGVSPWAKEFYRNTEDLLRLGFLHSGLADSLGLADAMREGGVPSLEVARHQAFSGPLGGLDSETQL